MKELHEMTDQEATHLICQKGVDIGDTLPEDACFVLVAFSSKEPLTPTDKGIFLSTNISTHQARKALTHILEALNQNDPERQ